jgi:small subunit ribosomal protein S5
MARMARRTKAGERKGSRAGRETKGANAKGINALEPVLTPVNGGAAKEEPRQKPADLSGWKPKTELGKKVKNREILNIDEILDNSSRILEPEIVDALLTLEHDLLLTGQSKGKFGGGARRIFRQTQKKTMEGNKPKFSTLVVVGDRNGHIGLGFGGAKETVPAREKSLRKAKLNIFRIRRGCGSWQCGCGKPHSIPFTVTGKCGSVEVKFMPAPKGKGLCCASDVAKTLALAGIKDIWAKTRGQTRNRLNFIYACEDALKQLVKTKVQPEHFKTIALVEGSFEDEKKQLVGELRKADQEAGSVNKADKVNEAA